jgi:uncharacterized protein YqjF (DUF2071 family)
MMMKLPCARSLAVGLRRTFAAVGCPDVPAALGGARAGNATSMLSRRAARCKAVAVAARRTAGSKHRPGTICPNRATAAAHAAASLL